MCNRAFELIFNDKGYLGLQSKQAIKPASGKGRARQEIVLMDSMFRHHSIGAVTIYVDIKGCSILLLNLL